MTSQLVGQAQPKPAQLVRDLGQHIEKTRAYIWFLFFMALINNDWSFYPTLENLALPFFTCQQMTNSALSSLSFVMTKKYQT